MGGAAGLEPAAHEPGPHIYAADLAGDPERLAAFRDSGALLFHGEGLGATVTVLQRSSGARVLRINWKTDASTEADKLAQGLIGALPGLLARDPSEQLVIGLGSGMTLAAALDLPLEKARAVELLPEVVGGARAFGELLGHPLSDPRTELVVGDGRHLLLHEERTYDVISSVPTNLFVSARPHGSARPERPDRGCAAGSLGLDEGAPTPYASLVHGDADRAGTLRAQGTAAPLRDQRPYATLPTASTAPVDRVQRRSSGRSATCQPTTASAAAARATVDARQKASELPVR